MRAARGKHKNIPVIHFNAFQHPLQFRMPFGLPLLFLLLLLLLLALLLFYIFNRNSRHTQMCERTHRVTCVALRATSDERWLISHHCEVHTMNTIINYLTCARSLCVFSFFLSSLLHWALHQCTALRQDMREANETENVCENWFNSHIYYHLFLSFASNYHAKKNTKIKTTHNNS